MKITALMAMFASMLFFCGCANFYNIFETQQKKDATAIVSVLFVPTKSNKNENSVEYTKVLELNNKLVKYVQNYFSANELREISVFYSNGETINLMQKLRRESNNQQYRKELNDMITSQVSKETLKRLNSKDFLKGFFDIIDDTITEVTQ